MTRETKLGLAVATSFLSLVGGVLGVKLYRGDGPDPRRRRPPPRMSRTRRRSRPSRTRKSATWPMS